MACDRPEYRGRVKRIAITGGIGAGKTTVTDKLSTLGFSVVDADEAARRVVEKGRTSVARAARRVRRLPCLRPRAKSIESS